MGKREQIDLTDYREPAAEAYADDVVDSTAFAIYSADFVNNLIKEAYLAGAASMAPTGTIARWEYAHLPAHRAYPVGRYRQQTRAVNAASNTPGLSVIRRRVLASPWENETGAPVTFENPGNITPPAWMVSSRTY